MATDPSEASRDLVYLRPREPGDAEIVHRWYEDTRIATIMGDLPRSLAWRRHRYETSSPATATTCTCSSSAGSRTTCRSGGRTCSTSIAQHGSAASGSPSATRRCGARATGPMPSMRWSTSRSASCGSSGVWLDTDAHNVRAQAVYAKAGFVREGVLRHAFYQDGRWSDDVRMAMIRDEWLALDRPRSWDLAAAEIEARGEPT